MKSTNKSPHQTEVNQASQQLTTNHDSGHSTPLEVCIAQTRCFVVILSPIIIAIITTVIVVFLLFKNHHLKKKISASHCTEQSAATNMGITETYLDPFEQQETPIDGDASSRGYDNVAEDEMSTDYTYAYAM